VTPDELAAIMHRGAELAGRRMLLALVLEGFYAADELAALWLIVVDGHPQPLGLEVEGSPVWQAAMAEVQTAMDEAAQSDVKGS
jgi:hypothetical protein